MVIRAAHAQRHLIRKVWPDKLLYGAIMLLVVSLVGLLHGLAVMLFDVTLSSRVPALIRAWPIEITVLLSGAAAALSFVSMRKLKTVWGIAGGVCGALSLGLLGLGSLLSLLALAFLVAARLEGEDDTPPSERLSPDEWPDKSLGASLVLLLGGIVTLAWGALLLTDRVRMGGAQQEIFGAVEVGAGVVALAAAYMLYHQRGFWLGLAACVGCIGAFGAYVLGPLLGLAGLGLVFWARSEDEFA